MSRPFIANRGGPCAADCGERIRPGDWVAYVGEELMHEDCADGGPSDRVAEARVKPVCPRCWTVHAGDCL